MPVSPTGRIITNEGKEIGGQVNVQTGEIITPSPIAVDTLNQSISPFDTPSYNPVNYGQATSSAISSALTPISTPPTTAPDTKVTSIADRLKAMFPGFSQQQPVSRTTPEEIEAAKQAEAKTLKEFEDVSAELKALEMEKIGIPEQIQQESIGRGVTAGGVAPIQAARLRENFLRTLPVAVRADVIANRLTNAQNKINTLLDLQEKDQKAQTDYYNTLFDRALKIAGADQEEEIRQKQEELKQWQSQRDEFNLTRRDFVQEAINAGNYSLAAQMGSAQDVNTLQSLASQLRRVSEWSEPYLLGGDYVQKNSQTGEIRTAVNVPETNQTAINSRIDQVLDGFITLSQLTPSEQQKVRDDLFAKGFGSDTPPKWFIKFLQDTRQQSLLPDVIREEWIKYRDSVMDGQQAEANNQESGVNFDDF